MYINICYCIQHVLIAIAPIDKKLYDVYTTIYTSILVYSFLNDVSICSRKLFVIGNLHVEMFVIIVLPAKDPILERF